MSYSVTATFSNEQAKLEGTYPINMYVLNASLSGFDPIYYADLNQDIYGYSMNATGDLQATETVYTGLGIEQDKFQTDTEGGTPEITISVPNVNRVVESVIQNNSYLRGRDVHILQTFGEYLPSGSDYRHIGTTPDKNTVIKEKLYIDSVTSNEQVVQFKCKPKFMLRNVVLPRRKFLRSCSREFGDEYCGANATVVASWVTCDYSLEDCKERGNDARFGGFAALPRGAITII